MQQTLRDAADVRAWARSYPWTTLGAAAAAGFLAASTLLPKKKPRDEENEALLERILTDEQIESRLRELAAEDVRKPAKGGLLHTLATTLVQTFGPAVQTAVAAALAGQAPPQGPFDEDAAAEAGDHETANGQQSSAPPPLPDQE